MGRQTGLIKITGILGDTIYYRSKYGYLTRGRSKISKERILIDTCYILTRYHMREFSLVIETSKLIWSKIKKSVNDYNKYCSFNSIVSLLSRIQKADCINLKGNRTISEGLRHISDLTNLCKLVNIENSHVINIIKNHI